MFAELFENLVDGFFVQGFVFDVVVYQALFKVVFGFVLFQFRKVLFILAHVESEFLELLQILDGGRLRIFCGQRDALALFESPYIFVNKFIEVAEVLQLDRFNLAEIIIQNVGSCFSLSIQLVFSQRKFILVHIFQKQPVILARIALDEILLIKLLLRFRTNDGLGSKLFREVYLAVFRASGEILVLKGVSEDVGDGVCVLILFI